MKWLMSFSSAGALSFPPSFCIHLPGLLQWISTFVLRSSFFTFVLSTFFVFSTFFLAGAQGQTASVTPSVFPLAVRSPYLNHWLSLPGSNGNAPGGIWPTSSSGQVTGWAGIIRVDGKAFMWQGTDENKFGVTKTIASSITPTKTIFTLEAGPIRFNLTYLSPVEPSDWVRQSFPFTYLSVDVESTDGQEHEVQLYSDVTGEFLSSDSLNPVSWNTTRTSTTLIHSMRRGTPNPFVERKELADDATLYYTLPSNTTGMTFQTFLSLPLRLQFNATGALNNTADQTTTRQIRNGGDFPVLAMAVDLGMISRTASPIVWGLGLVREPIIRTVKGGGIELRSAYFWTKYDSIESAIDAFTTDFQDATARSNTIDTDVMTKAGAVSEKYADLAALSVLQTFAAIDITVGRTQSNQVNSSDVKAYMKDVGNSGRVNAVETLYAAFPSLLYFNSSLPGLLLSPLLEFQDSSVYPNNYAAPDLGNSYPDVKGNVTDQERFGVENSGSMLVMALAHAKKSGDGTLIQRHYGLLRSWADYLTSKGVQPSTSMTVDGASRAVSNMILKSIAGIYAMGQINRKLETVGASATVTANYLTAASSNMAQWQNLSFQGDHITSTYGDQASWNLLFNTYALNLLNTTMMDPKILSAQATFYRSQAAGTKPFGLPVDSNTATVVRSDWLMLTAAGMNEPGIRNTIIDMVHARAFSSDSSAPWAAVYDSDSGNAIRARGSPAQGAAFALLAQAMPDKPTAINPAVGLGNSSRKAGPDAIGASSGETNIGAAIAGVVIGALIFLGIIVGFLVWYLRRRRSMQEDLEKGSNRSQIDPVAEPGYGKSTRTSTSSSFYASSTTHIVSNVSNASNASSVSNVSNVSNVIPNPFTGAQEAAANGLPSRPAPSIRPAPPRVLRLVQAHSVAMPSSPVAGSSTAGPSTHPDALQSQVEELRREMALMRKAQNEAESSRPQQQEAEFEPPPMYEARKDEP